jgi:hypothetical protein
MCNHPVFEAVDRGEELVKAINHPLLRHVHRANVVRWCIDGKITALKIGRSYFSTDKLIRESLLPKPAPAMPAIADRNNAALESIARTVKGGKRK